MSSFINLLDIVYPVGSVYMSTNSTSPATLVGGTWTQVKDMFLLGAGSSYAAGDTGGEVEHTLTINEMPSHSHQLKNVWHNVSGKWYTPNTGAVWLNDVWDNTASTGGDAAHNNMPPYYTVYIWYRIA